ncbi:hypothetical protein AB0I49_22065 [Streptomyces sp. NPDC050617]|uniref:hypothetical protein n=1 Tax=Streptomyces sp. NPDC050617 TaxID=3154628 RepID=UPI00343F1F6D
MPEARIDTTEARPEASAQAAAAGSGAGKHRGPALPEETPAPVHGKHRRTEDDAVAAAQRS